MNVGSFNLRCNSIVAAGRVVGFRYFNHSRIGVRTGSELALSGCRAKGTPAEINKDDEVQPSPPLVQTAQKVMQASAEIQKIMSVLVVPFFPSLSFVLQRICFTSIFLIQFQSGCILCCVSLILDHTGVELATVSLLSALATMM